MTRWIMLLALVLGACMAASYQALEKLVQASLTMYLLAAGFLVLVLQRRAWEFLRPLFLIGIALLFLPPLFHDLLVYAQRNLKAVLPFNVNMGSGWLWAPLAALAVFVLVRLITWYRRRPRTVRQHIYKERERVLPQFDDEDMR